MTDLVARWPLWYWLLALYTAYQGVSAWRYYHRTIAPALAEAAASATSPLERGKVDGMRIRSLAPVLLWFLGAIGLAWGGTWLRVLVALAYAIPTPGAFRSYAYGAATGRKAAQLAAAPEYVMGRATPATADYAMAVVYIAYRRVIPFIATVYAIWTLP